ncbi:MAG: hypothetical protein KDJ75_05185 [Alphaproteobacteria bacterium]|nr:hypothetical protein [Alphaproteobacteria bacterium]
MKFVFFGYDFMLPCIRRLQAEGHELVGLMGFECDNIFNFNTGCQELARSCGAPFILSPAQDIHIEDFLDRGAEVFFAAGYPFKIPPIDEARAFALNLHPAFLPKARGIMPVPHIIMNEDQEAAGLSLHKMTQKFDQGAILSRQDFALSPRETVETYSAKVAIRAPDMIARAFADLPALWENAQAQNEEDASYYPPPGDDMRMMDWSKSVAEIDKTGRAFGRFGALAAFDGMLWAVYGYDFWEEAHSLIPGTIAARMSREIVIAAKDGFICLKDYIHLSR